MGKLKKGSSKLGSQQPATKPAGVVTTHTQKTTATPKSFRLSGDDIANLKQITQAVNGISHSKVSETKVVKALLQLGSELPPEKVLKALREIL
ncbi:hypothetical protein [Endozoicomonas numazuensis]|uniref:Uncharacterized protein n=1 Tax=Endozoicomonas numazuensis TaxID=1137799 RepID=A0A081N9A6_9GAMM|nr:hypothetical protein [Endozoicomonas numazuensis]KEQ15029.1 hypothetical protein GZ78_24415 [Endozoicomonas numazuensis]